MTLRETREIRADVHGESGRVRAWVAEKEPARLSIAVPGDRAVLDARDVRALAKWLEERAREMEAEESSARQRVTTERTLGLTSYERTRRAERVLREAERQAFNGW